MFHTVNATKRFAMPDTQVSPSATRPLPLALALGFVGTGVGVALPGAILPVLLARWHLRDAGGGTLFLMSFLGSSLGALLLSGSLLRGLALGGAAVALAAWALTFAGAALAVACMLLYGLGLGLAMTAISMLAQSPGGTPGRRLVQLNLLWAVGALVCPLLALPTLRSGNLELILMPLAWGFTALAVWAGVQCWVRKDRSIRTRTIRSLKRTSLPGRVRAFAAVMPLSLVLLVTLTTGVEAAAGGWLATYAKRAGDASGLVVAAPTCLWAGLLLSRLVWSFPPARLPEQTSVRGSLLLMAASALLLLAHPQGLPFFLAAAGLGFGIGPVYPLLLARALRLQASGLIFFLSGVSSACLPWLTGLVSSQSGSLRVGFVVPAAATVLMAGLAFQRDAFGT